MLQWKCHKSRNFACFVFAIIVVFPTLKTCQIYSDHLINISCWISLKLSSAISLVAVLKKSLKCKCFPKGYRPISSSCILFYHPIRFSISPCASLILKCYIETHLDVPYPQALLSALLSLRLQSLYAKQLFQSLSTLPLTRTLPPQNLLQSHFLRSSSGKVSLKRSVSLLTSVSNIMTWRQSSKYKKLCLALLASFLASNMTLSVLLWPL